jgi:HPt (histidine-containing phosphotransfer) domain-containing protein
VSAERPAIDLATLDALDGVFGDRATTDELAREFVANARRCLAAIEHGDAAEARRGAHTLASSSPMVGAYALGTHAADLERRLVAGETVTNEPTLLASDLAELEQAWTAHGRLALGASR